MSNISTVNKFDQIPFISDHDLIFCSLNILLCCSPAKCTYTIRDYKNIDMDALQSDLSDLSWTDWWFLPTVDDKLNWLIMVLSHLFEKYVLVITIKPVNDMTPWLSDSVLEALKLRNVCRSRWKKNPTDDNWYKYISKRRYAHSVVKQAKIKYYCKELNESYSSQRLWKN